ncbi:MAG: Tn3 family transposase [Methylocella sp.]
MGVALVSDQVLPSELLRYLADQLGVHASVFADYSRRPQTRTDHARELAERLGLRVATREDGPLMIDLAATAAWKTDQGALIVSELMEGLRSRKTILPAPQTLERAGIRGRAKARRLAADALLSPLTTEQIALIDALVVNNAELKRTPLAWLRDVPESPSAGNLTTIVDRLTHVRKLGLAPSLRGAIHESRFRQFAREGAVAPAFLLSDYSARRRRATLVAQMIEREAILSDAAIDMFDKLVGSMFTSARKRREVHYQTTTRDVGRLMRLFDQTIDALSTAREADADPFNALDERVGWFTLLKAKPEVRALAEFADEDPLVTATQKYMTLRKFAPAFLDAFMFKANSERDPLLLAIQLLRNLNKKERGEIPDDAPMPFSKKHWKQVVVTDGKVSRRLYETAICTTLRDHLRSGDVWIEGTRKFQRFDQYLLPKAEVPKVTSQLSLPGDVDSYLSDRSALLDARLRRFERQLLRGKLEGVELRNDRLHITPLKAITSPEADRLDRAIDALLPRIRITELLNEVHRRTGFAAKFVDLRTGKPHENPSAVLAAILADANNQGLESMAQASQGVTYAQLAWTHNWYLSDENYAAALATIIDAHHAHPFADIWGNGTTSSSDGQYFRAGRGGGGEATVNAKYGVNPGVRFYTHVSDQYGPFHSLVISATGSEAPHVLDGLLMHGTALQIAEHYTDTGGATDHVFGLSPFLGYRFVPRLRDLPERRLASIARSGDYPGLKAIMGKPIQTDVIRGCWDEVIHLAASLKAGAVAPSLVLKKLSAYRRQNRVDLALSEIGRIERTLFTLDWLEDPELRRRCHAGLNKGESRHFLAQAIYIHRQGRLADRTFQNQSFRASGLNLVIAAIIYWNTLYMARAVQHLRSSGISAPDDLLTHVAPLGWSHISLSGDYLWEQAAQVGGDFRLLRIEDSPISQVA